MKVRIAKPLKLGAPGDLDDSSFPQPRLFSPGQWVECIDVDAPGEVAPSGVIYDDWSFWTSSDIDYANIFDLSDIDAVAMPHNSEHVQTLLRLESFVELQVLPEKDYQALGT